MKTLLLVVLFISNLQIIFSSECSQLLYRYYSCKHLNITKEGPNDSDPNEYFNLNGDLGNEFFEKKLSIIRSFGSAMNYFRRIYVELKDCMNDACRCAKKREDGINFGSIFTNSGHFSYLKLITSKIKVIFILEFNR